MNQLSRGALDAGRGSGITIGCTMVFDHTNSLSSIVFGQGNVATGDRSPLLIPSFGTVSLIAYEGGKYDLSHPTSRAIAASAHLSPRGISGRRDRPHGSLDRPTLRPTRGGRFRRTGQIVHLYFPLRRPRAAREF